MQLKTMQYSPEGSVQVVQMSEMDCDVSDLCMDKHG